MIFRTYFRIFPVIFKTPSESYVPRLKKIHNNNNDDDDDDDDDAAMGQRQAYGLGRDSTMQTLTPNLMSAAQRSHQVQQLTEQHRARRTSAPSWPAPTSFVLLP